MKNRNIQFIASARFDAARSVSTLPEQHKSRNLHGHSFWTSIISSFDNNNYLSGLEHLNLKEKLLSVTEKLDYIHLNKRIKIPSDENLAKWIQQESQCLLNDNIEITGLQSTKDQGVHLNSNGVIHLWKRFQFEAAHQLPNVDVSHKCGRMHGHSFQVIIHANTKLESKDFSIDYDQLSRIWGPIDNQLNYNCLNEIKGLSNPTSEIIAQWIWRKLVLVLPSMSCISVYETASCGAHFDGKEFKIWKDFSFDSSIRLDQGDRKLRRLHGHTFLLRLNLSSSLDRIMGWTKDFGDVKVVFKPIFKILDHQPLHENLDLKNTNILSIADWILNEAQPVLPELSGIELYEIEGCGVVLKNNYVGPIMPLTQK